METVDIGEYDNVQIEPVWERVEITAYGDNGGERHMRVLKGFEIVITAGNCGFPLNEPFYLCSSRLPFAGTVVVSYCQYNSVKMVSSGRPDEVPEKYRQYLI